MHDRFGNVIAESNGTGPAGTLREYIWLPEAEIAPMFKSRAQVDRPLAVVEDVLTGTPVTWLVHVDHLNRPVRMTDAAKAVVWDAVWTPWGLPHAITGTGANNQRFPGQWFQLEAGLHTNWHRHYDPSLGRYTQPDPLGFVDGPSVYGYGRASPQVYVDPDGRWVWVAVGIGAGLGLEYLADYVEQNHCGCSGSSNWQYGAAPTAGGVLADYLAGAPYPRSGVGGSTGYTSYLSSNLSKLFGNSGHRIWTPIPNNFYASTSNVGRAIGRWAGPIAGAYMGYDMYRIGRCLM